MKIKTNKKLVTENYMSKNFVIKMPKRKKSEWRNNPTVYFNWKYESGWNILDAADFLKSRLLLGSR